MGAGPDPNRPAIVWADEANPHMLRSMSLGQLAARSAHVAHALRAAGLQPGELLPDTPASPCSAQPPAWPAYAEVQVCNGLGLQAMRWRLTCP